MGGGGGGHSPSRRDLDDLERIAREKLQQGAGEKTRNVFISFAYDDVQEVNLLRGQAKNEFSDIEFNDWSLKEPFNSERAEYIKQGISQKIKQSSVTIVYVSDNTANSEWVKWEIERSLELGKGVIAFHKGDSPPKKLPSILSKNNIKVQPWTHKGLNQAIEDAARER